VTWVATRIAKREGWRAFCVNSVSWFVSSRWCVRPFLRISSIFFLLSTYPIGTADVEVELINQSWLGIRIDSRTNSHLQFTFQKLVFPIITSHSPGENRAIVMRTTPCIAIPPDQPSNGTCRMERVVGRLPEPTGAF
jgi:hypothetical protein